MMQDDPNLVGEEDWPFSNPAPFLWFGLAAVAVAWVISWIVLLLPNSFLSIFRAFLIAAGVISAGGAVALRPRAVFNILIAGLTAVVGAVSLDRDWDSAWLLLMVASGLALFAAALLSLPELGGLLWPQLGSTEEKGRRFGKVAGRSIFGFLIVVHFLGIICTTLSVPANGRPASWLAVATVTWMQPYYQFTYLRNAYHFYSPEPGPATLMWFRVEYEDHSARWVYLPDRKNPGDAPDPLAQEFTRRLSITNTLTDTENVPLLDGTVMLDRATAQEEFRIRGKPIYIREQRGPNGELLGEKVLDDVVVNEDRALEKPMTGIVVLTAPLGIPFNPAEPRESQYLVPNLTARKHLYDFARHIATHYPSLVDPNLKVTGIKIYRVLHKMLEPNQFAHVDPQTLLPDMSPEDRWTYRAFYMGEYGPDGLVKNLADPFLFWEIPIFLEEQSIPAGPGGAPMRVSNAPKPILRDCVKYHGAMPTNEKGVKQRERP